MKEIEPYWPKRIRVRLIIRARGLFITVSRQTINDKSTTNRISKKKIQNRIYFWFPGDILYLKNWEIGFTFCLYLLLRFWIVYRLRPIGVRLLTHSLLLSEYRFLFESYFLCSFFLHWKHFSPWFFLTDIACVENENLNKFF